MKKAAALLDSLMGPSRNLADSEKSGDDFKKKDVCKPYLVGCCPPLMYSKKADPHGELTADIGGGKALRACTKTHAKGLRIELQGNPSAEKYKAQYERELIKKLVFIIDEAQDRVKKLKGKCRPPDADRLKIPDVVKCEMSKIAEEVNKWQKEAEEKGNKGDVHGSQLCMDEARKAQERHNHLAGADFHKAFPGESVCELCGIIYFNGKCMDEIRGGKITDQYEDEHFEGEQHAAFKAMNERLDCLKEKYKDVPEPDEKEDKEENEEKKDKKEERDEKKDKKDSDKKRSRSRSRREEKKDKKDSDKKRSRSRSRSRKGGDKKRSRSRKGGDKKRSRSRSRKGGDKKRSRSRSRRRSRSRSRDRKRSRSRSRDRRRR